MKTVVTLLKSFCIALSMFSKIPVPQFEWKEEDMRFMVIFFPFVGIVIGGLTFLWGMAYEAFAFSRFTYACIGLAIPLIVTGGFHVDGYMDTMDAFHSYQPRERKLEILKDSHIGAFSVICLLLYTLLFLGGYAEIKGKEAVLLLGISFWLSRIFSAVGILNFRCAKKDGLLFLFSNRADRIAVNAAVGVQLVLCVVLLWFVSGVFGLVLAAAAAVTFGYYYRKAKKELGGVTGDTSGWFTTLCEAVLVLTIAAGCIFHLI